MDASQGGSAARGASGRQPQHVAASQAGDGHASSHAPADEREEKSMVHPQRGNDAGRTHGGVGSASEHEEKSQPRERGPTLRHRSSQPSSGTARRGGRGGASAAGATRGRGRPRTRSPRPAAAAGGRVWPPEDDTLSRRLRRDHDIESDEESLSDDVCGCGTDKDEALLICDGICGRVFHASCMSAEERATLTAGDEPWWCLACAQGRRAESIIQYFRDEDDWDEVAQVPRSNRETVLHVALMRVDEGEPKIAYVRHLLTLQQVQRSVKRHEVDVHGRTALHQCVGIRAVPVDVTLRLLELGAHPNLPNRAGDMPTHEAFSRWNVNALLALLASPRTNLLQTCKDKVVFENCTISLGLGPGLVDPDGSPAKRLMFQLLFAFAAPFTAWVNTICPKPWGQAQQDASRGYITLPAYLESRLWTLPLTVLQFAFLLEVRGEQAARNFNPRTDIVEPTDDELHDPATKAVPNDLITQRQRLACAIILHARYARDDEPQAAAAAAAAPAPTAAQASAERVRSGLLQWTRWLGLLKDHRHFDAIASIAAKKSTKRGSGAKHLDGGDDEGKEGEQSDQDERKDGQAALEQDEEADVEGGRGRKRARLNDEAGVAAGADDAASSAGDARQPAAHADVYALSGGGSDQHDDAAMNGQDEEPGAHSSPDASARASAASSRGMIGHDEAPILQLIPPGAQAAGANQPPSADQPRHVIDAEEAARQAREAEAALRSHDAHLADLMADQDNLASAERAAEDALAAARTARQQQDAAVEKAQQDRVPLLDKRAKTARLAEVTQRVVQQRQEAEAAVARALATQRELEALRAEM